MYASTTLLDALNFLLLQQIKPAILLIDVDEPSMDNSYNETMLKNQENVIQRAAEINLPIFDIVLHGVQTIDRLHHIAKQSSNYIPYRKNMESAFDEENIKLCINNQRTTLCQYLQSINCKHIFIMGYADDDCVYETAYDALNLGFEVHVDRVFNLGADLAIQQPWDSINQNPQCHQYTELSVPSTPQRNRKFHMVNMKLMKP